VPAVSVITPAWNAAAFIRDTIDSVLAQTVTDWEMVIVDDGSTDETVAIVQSYAARDPRVRLVRQANSGPSAARNNGMRSARGDLFAFLDSDDLWDPGFLQAQLDVFRRFPETGLVTGNGIFLGGPFDGAPKRPVADGFPVLPLTELIANECAIFIMTVFRRSVFDTIGGFDEMQWQSEDYDFWLRAALAGFVFRRNPQPLGCYRVRGDSLSRNRARMIRGMLQTFEKTRPHCTPGTPERQAVDAQISRFSSELLLEEAKDALERGDAAAAATQLRALRARGGSRLVGVIAWLAEHAPAAAGFAYRARTWRPAWLRDRRRTTSDTSRATSRATFGATL
jgi:teichuronic acid biosynthesis glycosyltransferase TuaG